MPAFGDAERGAQSLELLRCQVATPRLLVILLDAAARIGMGRAEPVVLSPVHQLGQHREHPIPHDRFRSQAMMQAHDVLAADIRDRHRPQRRPDV